MEYLLKEMKRGLLVDKIAYVHFFEFSQEFFTKTEKHPFYELVFVSSGALEIGSDTFNGTISKNQMIIHRPNDYHFFSCEKGVNPTVIIIGFTCTENTIDGFATEPVTLNHFDVTKLAEIVKEARNIFAPPYDIPMYDMKKKKNLPFGGEQLLVSLIEQLLISLTREKLIGNDGEKKENKILFSANQIVSYITNNYKEKITLDELAFIFSTNRSTLCKEFKKATGKTIVEFMNDKKIDKAKSLIISTDLTFTEIAEKLNFISIHYFTRLFKSTTGLTPKEFRKKNKA